MMEECQAQEVTATLEVLIRAQERKQWETYSVLQPKQVSSRLMTSFTLLVNAFW
jgi:tagatose-1,6-bisphosphate aldolase